MSIISRFQRIQWLRPSVIALLAANLVPLVALFVFHWDVFSLLFLFWLENVIIGVLNVFKMLLAGVGAKDLPRYGSLFFTAFKFFLIPFFCLHYGMFTFGHGLFIVAIFDRGAMHDFGGFSFQLIAQIIRDNHLEWPFAALVVSHLISFGWDYLWSGAFRRTNPLELMTQPYRRVVVMHVTVIIGALLTMVLHLPEAALILLVVLKTITDLWGHEGEREKLAANNAATDTPATTPTRSLQDALQQAMQARASQTGQAVGEDKRQVVIVLAVILVIAGLFLSSMVYFVYDFIRPFTSHSRTAAAKPILAASASWTLDLKNAQFPNVPAAGKFRGGSFHLEHAVFANGTLNLREGSGTNSRVFVIPLSLRRGEALSGHSFHCLPDAAAPPEIKLAWHEDGTKKAQTQAFAAGYAMKLDFFWPQNGKTPGMIYLCLPDEQKSYLAGSIEVVTKKSKSSSDDDK